jgi:hypothetical protein
MTKNVQFNPNEHPVKSPRSGTRMSLIIQELERQLYDAIQSGSGFLDFHLEGSVHNGEITKDFSVIIKQKCKTKS